MGRTDKRIPIIVGLLIAAVAVLSFLNRGDADLKRALEEDRRFLLKADGQEAVSVGLQDILDIGAEEFTERLATSTAPPREVSLRGVELRLIYEAVGMDISGASSFAVRGLDGYYSPLSPGEVAQEQRVYVCIAMDGELLKEKSAGGWGPFLMVLRGSRFSQRWCKYVEEIYARY